MACAGGKYNDVAGIESEFVTAGTAKDYSPLTGCDAEYFMCCRMVVMEVVDPVSPLRWPAIAIEGLFESCSGIRTVEVECTAIENDWKAIVVWDPFVAGKLNRLGIFGAGQKRA